jgi:RNA polymerase sigma-70 factor (ECF subfamily)
MSAFKQLSDKDLIQLYCEGNEAALSEALHRHKSKLFARIISLVKDYEIANDIFQETFFRFIKTVKAGKYREEEKFANYIFRIASNICYDHLREKVKMPGTAEVNNESVFNFVKLKQKSAEDNLNDKHNRELLRKMFDKLTPAHQEILYYRCKLNLSFKEIAEKKNLSINTCLSQYSYAVKAMKKVAEKYSLMSELNF